MGRLTSRRKIKKAPIISKTGVELESCHCRRCMKDKKPMDFFDAVDFFLDTSGKMSICKSCCNDIYARMYLSEHTMEKALLRCCRILNVRYDEDAVSTTQERIKKMFDEGRETENIFGIYKMSLSAIQKTRITNRDVLEDRTFVEPGYNIVANPMDEDEVDGGHDLKQFWGENFEYDDYVWLEAEYAEWKKTHKIDTRSEISLLKMIVLKLFDIRKSRIEGGNVNALEKQFQDLLKTSALTPAQSNIASQGKNQDCFGIWVKEIEKTEPAEWWDGKRDAYVDMAGFDKYCNDYILRPISNFFGVTKDFEIIDDDIQEEDDTEEDYVPYSLEENNDGNIS
jgi:hypothetical protein